jgi:hypothetical protein
MAYTSVANPPLHNGDHFEGLSYIPSPDQQDQYMDTDTGDILVYMGSGFQKMASSFGSRSTRDFLGMVAPSGQNGGRGVEGVNETPALPWVMDHMIFHENIKELAIFQKINQERYFKLKNMYASTDIENRGIASAIVKELVHQMMSE